MTIADDFEDVYDLIPQGFKGDYAIIKTFTPDIAFVNMKNDLISQGWPEQAAIKRIAKFKKFNQKSLMLTEIESGLVWMTNSFYEVKSHKELYTKAKGNVLIGGLGIGLAPTLIKNKQAVTSIKIVEINQDVIDLVWDHIKDNNKMSLHVGGILNFMNTTTEKFDIIYIDILKEDIMFYPDEFALLKNKAQKMLNPNGEILFWRSIDGVNL